MPDVILSLAQFIYIIWPFVIVGALVYSFQGVLINEHGRRRRGGKLRYLGQNMRTNLLVTWTALVVVWLVTLFATQPNLAIMPEPWNSALFLGGYALLLIGHIGRLGWFKRRLNAHLDFHRTQSIQHLKDMDPYAFEALVTETYRTLGYRVKHVGHSGDHGVDVELYTPSGQHWVVQCKRYRDSVGESIVRDLFGTMTSERAARGVLVTTAEITPPARAWAQGKPIELIDGPALLDLIARARERSEGSLFDRLAHGIDHLLHPHGVTPPGLSPRRAASRAAAQPSPARNGHRPAPALPRAPAADPGQQTQPVRVRTRVYQAPDRSATVPLEITHPSAHHNGNGRAAHPSAAAAASAAAASAAAASTTAASAPAATAAAASAAAANTAAAPAHPHPHAPACPACGARMVLRPPRPGDRPGRRYYRCSNYPNCRAVVEKD